MSLHREKIKDNKPSQGTNKPVVRDSNWSSVSALTRFIILSISIGILIVPIFLSSNNVSATGGSMTVTISDTTVDLNVSPSTNGTFAKSDATTIGVSTTNATGYTLSISANSSSSSNPTSLINGTDNTKMFPSIQSAITEDQFKALDGGTAYNNMWGYLPSKYCNTNNSNNSNNSLNCSTNTNFLPSPTTNGDILDITSTANTTINEYELTVGARVDTTATLGAYSNVFVVDVVANAVPYTIIFDDNVVDNMPTDLSGETDDSTITLPSNIPTRDGYTFLGWCTVKPNTSTTNTGISADVCTGGSQYSPSDNIPIDQTSGNNNYHLYSMWQELTMQTFTNSLCATQATNNPITLTDERDGNEYTVRYINNNCWMTQNLAFTGSTLNSTTSNIASNYTESNPLTLTWYDFADSENTGNSGHCYANGSSGNGFNYACAHIPSIPDLNAVNHLSYTIKQLGAWYNYVGASAGTVKGADNTSAANFDICPSGWHLPTESDFTSLYGLWSNFPLLYGGHYQNGTFIDIGNGAHWLASNASGNGAQNRYGLFYYTNIGRGTTSYITATNGNFIRCIRTT